MRPGISYWGRSLGFVVSGQILLDRPTLAQTTAGTAWLTGGTYGPEGGVVAIGVRIAVIAGLVVVARRRGKSGHGGPVRHEPA